MSAHAQISGAHTASFQAVRPRLFGIAYRVLGSATDVDDVAQDAWMR
jgi:RNA polymerase sigma-70 factor, ECF subfamily